MKLDVNAKAGDVKGKIQIWNDFETWADNAITSGTTGLATTTDTQPGSSSAIDSNGDTYERNTISIREAWVSFPLPFVPVTVTAGHQLLTIGNGWFIRSQHYGSDAWVISNTTGPNTAAFVNIKFAENDVHQADDIDVYSLLDVFKLNDNMAVGADMTIVKDRSDHAAMDTLMNLGVNFNGKIGPVALKAELDLQAGEIDNAVGTDEDYKGNQIVVQAAVPVGPVTINATIARGSGDDSADDEIETYQNYLDIDPHYTFLYEYKINQAGTPAGVSNKNFGFSNTTAIGVGATFAATKNLTVGADIWQLMATEDVDDKVSADPTATTNEIGLEVDVKVNWQVAENLKWNWVAGILKPGDGLGKDDAIGIQGILSFAF
jgi:hypothetical protein